MSTELSVELLQRFSHSLPSKYRTRVDAATTVEHARVAAGRGDQPVNVGRFTSYRPGTTGLCVVGEDRPGLLATIGAALVLHGLEISDAEAYTRKLEGGPDEALDIFWVRRDSDDTSELTDEEIEALCGTMSGLVSGTIDLEQARERTRHAPAPAQGATVVRFLEDEDGAFATLEVEASDRPGLLLRLAHALYGQQLQIVGSELRTRDGKALDRFSLVERDGSPVSPERRLHVQVAVLTAVEEAMVESS